MYLVGRQLNMAGFIRTYRSENVTSSGPGSVFLSINMIGEMISSNQKF